MSAQSRWTHELCKGAYGAIILDAEENGIAECAPVHAPQIAAAPDLLAALKDMLAGWRYIREHHGDLYGVGWDRAQVAAEAAIAAATGETP